MGRTYSEMANLPTFQERFKYLRLNGRVGSDTFGYDRYLNQKLYKSPEWRRFRDEIIVRDNGCDLGCEDRPINGPVLIHHINPITEKDILLRSPCLFDPDNVICVSHNTHNAIHYSDESILWTDPVERKPGDTKLW